MKWLRDDRVEERIRKGYRFCQFRAYWFDFIRMENQWTFSIS